MALNRTNGAALLSPEDVENLVWKPARRQSVALAVGNVRTTDRSKVRVPVMTSSPGSGWVDEGAPIPLTDGVFTSIEIEPSKVAGLTIVTSEEVDDAEGNVLADLGAALVNDLSAKIDAAWFGNLPSPAQSGLAALAAAPGSEVQTVSAGSAYTSLDPFAEAASKIETAGGQVTAYVAGPTTALTLATIKAGTGSQVPLLAPGQDPAQPTRRLIEGRPLFVSTAVPTGTVWALDGTAAHVVIRKDATLTEDRSVMFTTDQVALRLIARVGFGFPLPNRVVKITTS